MEQKKFDLNSIIGFILIFGILIWIMYQNQPSEKEIALEKAKKEQLKISEAKADNAASAKELTVAKIEDIANDSVKLKALQGTLGGFAYSATLPSAKSDFTTIENKLISLKISNKGGYIVEAKLKDFKRIKKTSGEWVELIKNNNANLNIKLQTRDNRTLDTKNMYFEPTLTTVAGNQVLTMRLKAGVNQFLEYRYTLKPNDYMLDFDVRSQDLSQVLNTSKPLEMDWDLKAYRNEPSVSYENRYVDLRYEYEDGKDSDLGLSKEKTETADKVTYIAFKQHFFASILLTHKAFDKVTLHSKNLVNDEKIDTTFTKQFNAKVPLDFTNGEIDYKMNWYYGPADYKILKKYDRNIDRIVPLGWGIFGWINKFVFVPLFGFLSSFIAYGIAIIIFTIIIKIAMSPITYKSFLSQAKMKVLRPEINEVNEKFSKDPMKKQQETMKLYNKAGVNPMAGCIPALIQIPFMYASFQFFPSAIELRQKGFLWADDLSSFDAVVKLPFYIPFYGNHISLFPILAAIAIFFYMKMTTGDQQMAAPQQEGMPDMGKIMKIMIYISPLMMLFFFNNYGSGLSLYNFISNLITIGIMIVIKRYVVDEKKIHAQIQENKLKPKTQSKFQKKMQEMMEQAEAQKAKMPKK
ncbi:membrane protein insertase YidC [Flavobacterium noncentrifugens]|uniref:Membrane protein insertase YidC n=1 Tax=Flavobacterium noncentrifugens TaxID=1128970 RepID=A0A1G8YS39_9FLAO|nr:membrane protein insertase YidC [Flavobacterium noncentrifugens]GEP51341.1 membrane protein insertase YidC [Flavobacterium noncentrifugens]SDK05669.1 protein translocase subunit yidC [Flavobacterium noncentrifugens]